MVLATRRGDRDRGTPSGGIWDRNSLERTARGTLLFLVGPGVVTLMYRAGRPLVDRGSQGHSPYSPGLWLSICETKKRQGIERDTHGERSRLG